MVIEKGSAFEEGMAKSAKANGHQDFRISKAKAGDAISPSSWKAIHAGARCRPHKPDHQANSRTEKFAQLHATVRISKDGRFFRCESSPCLQEYLLAIFTPEFLETLLKCAPLEERDNKSAQDPSHDDDFLGAWQSIEAFKVHRFQLAKQSTRKGSSNRASLSAKLHKSRVHVQYESQFSPAVDTSVEDDSSEEDDSSDDEDFTGLVPEYKQLRIGDEEAVRKCYLDNLEAIQQVPCKYIAKAWVKVVEPKKQANHPYNGGSTKWMAIAKFGKEKQGYMTAPSWWPEQDVCPHKEPDHIKKHARLELLLHILCNINADWQELERSTNEIMDTKLDINPKKPVRPLLNEIYEIRKKQVAFLSGETDSDSIISVKVHKKSKAGQPQDRSTKPNDAEQGRRQRGTSVRQLTPKTASPSPTPSPRMQQSSIFAQERKCNEDRSKYESTSLQARTAEELARVWDSSSPIMYRTTSGNPTRTSAQDVQMQSEGLNHVAMQAMSLVRVPTQVNMDYGFQHPRARPSAIDPKPAHGVCRDIVQQPPVAKIEGSPTMRASWFPEASSSHHPSPSDAPPFFQQGASDVPMAFAIGFPTASNMQDNVLPITSSNPSQNSSFSDDTSYDNNFRGGSLNLAYQLQPTNHYGAFPMDMDEQPYPGNFPFPHR